MTSPRGFEYKAGPDDLVRVLRARGIRDARLLDAFRAVPRERFVPADRIDAAYLDVPVPIGHDQVTTQPSLIAEMVEALELVGTERVLEVGTGLGFQTAILALLAREVASIEWFEELARAAEANLRAVGITNVMVFIGDGTLGVPEHAPYDAIVTAAAAPAVPPPLVEQLNEHGRIVHPFGSSGNEVVIALRKERGRLAFERRITLAHFVPMVGAFGIGTKERDGFP
jgi:protein-L-isoaspartate(D-aspartate) O-methyltransferase